MDSTGKQLHPNWRALATVHIPLKRFIKEGTQEIEQGTHSASNKEKYEILNVTGKEIKEFYQELLENEMEPKKTDFKQTKIPKIQLKKEIQTPKHPFDVNKFHRYSMENEVKKLQEMDLLDKDLNVCDNYGWTALMMAACQGSLDTVKFLLDLGVDRFVKDKSGMTAKDLARKKGHFHIEQLLEQFEEKQVEVQARGDEDEQHFDAFFCEVCQREFSETSPHQHQTSTVHQFNMKSLPLPNKLQKFNIPPRNKGLQLMVKQGWDKESGLGPSSNTGRLYPVKTVIRKQRTGLGIPQDPARVTHFQAYDLAAVRRHNGNYYQKKPKNRNDMRREKVVQWKRDRRLRNELS